MLAWEPGSGISSDIAEPRTLQRDPETAMLREVIAGSTQSRPEPPSLLWQSRAGERCGGHGQGSLRMAWRRASGTSC